MNDVYPQAFKCDRCKWSDIVKTTDECFIMCTNDNIKSSWPDDYDKCKYFEEVNK